MSTSCSWRATSRSQRASVPALALFAERYPHVVYVHGNHEFYGSDRATVLAHTREVCARLGNVHLLDCDSIELAGQRFLGAPQLRG